eukprot:CAMPEP_0202048132 /NCGR_PEP_ID=MMETSP0963-20130614/2479_1 /ASSEMBLY_ACC=CAM_ASM_000494 /TAXON_ID=4773 /ORGANISM="Schizochytrium aggregatum, Strain ATCC28209" /LENGTH=41 /DNA_ID= /DNA_START= /DNA_END= /DNA_ORIENTATION=
MKREVHTVYQSVSTFDDESVTSAGRSPQDLMSCTRANAEMT